MSFSSREKKTNFFKYKSLVRFFLLSTLFSFVILTIAPLVNLEKIITVGALYSLLISLFVGALVSAAVFIFGKDYLIEPYEKLEESKIETQRAYEELDMILDAIPAYILYKDDKNTILRVNKHLADSLGVSKEDLEGAATETFYPEQLASKYLQDDLEVINSGIAKLGIEEEYPGAGEEKSWVRTDKVPLKTKNSGQVDSILVTATDITEEKRSRDLIIQKTTELERSNRALEEFAYFVSHDLQEPIRTVSNYVELLINHISKEQELDEKSKKYSEFILDSSQKMRAMIRDILTYAKLGSFGQIEDIDLNEIIEEVKVTHSSKIEETKTQILCGNLPTLKARRFEMLQLFQNLISNSIKFIPKGRNPKIEIDCEAVEDYYRFSVKDNGIGLEEKDYEKIFVVFQRVFNNEHDGTGVGLSICKKVVSNYSGEISIDSQIKEWTKFTFTLKSLVV